MTRNKLPGTGAVLLSLTLALLPLTLFAHKGDERETDRPGAENVVLGQISFPTTTRSKPAQQAFVEGVLYLHLFEYPLAREKFRQARALDPGFAMAYWGEAMTYNHPIWDQQQRRDALAVLNELGASPEARQSMTPSQKEKDYLAALDLLYGDGPKAERDRAYMRHMQEMAASYPRDDEVQLFYALSILGVSEGVRDVPAYMRSAAISQRVFCANRKNPGAAHYLIHAVDDPVHAPLGLEAARALASMAPDAGHAQHMASHIFLAAGMWDDVVAANQAAMRVVNRLAHNRGKPAMHWGHYNFWLLYGLLQQGRFGAAADLLKTAYREAVAAGAVPDDTMDLDPDDSQLPSVVQMWARYMIETGGRDRDIAAWTFDMKNAFDPTLTYRFVMALDALNRGDLGQARAHLVVFEDYRGRLKTAVSAKDRQAPGDLQYLDRLSIMDLELQARIAYAEKDTERALTLVRNASELEGEMPASFGPPFVDLPSAELLGELLLDAGRYAEAVDAFALQGERTRQKSLPLLGLMRAEKARGELQAAAHARARLAAIWKNADAAVRGRLDNAR